MSGLNIRVGNLEKSSLVPKLKGKKNLTLKGDFNVAKNESEPKDIKMFLEVIKAETDAFIQDKLDLMNPMVMTEEERIEHEEEMKAFKEAYDKARAGLELTDEEMRLIAKHSPIMYKILLEAKILREVYEEQLKNCKSKEEVANLKLAYDLTCTKNIKEAKASGDEVEYTRQVVFKNTIDDEHEQFLKTNDYMKLPDKVKKDKDIVVIEDVEIDFEKSKKKKNKDDDEESSTLDEIEIMKEILEEYMDKKKKNA